LEKFQHEHLQEVLLHDVVLCCVHRLDSSSLRDSTLAKDKEEGAKARNAGPEMYPWKNRLVESCNWL